MPLASNNTLYRGGKLSNDEIIKIKSYLENKIWNMPGAIVFSKCFLSFSKDINVAKRFLKGKNVSNLSKVFFILEKDNNIDYSLSTHLNIENISFLPDEKEVLFFPFSSFEIKDMKEEMENYERIYTINLKYLGQYIKDFQNEEKDIPDSMFKEEIVKSGLIEEKKVENKKIKQLFKYYINYKNCLEKQVSKIDQIFQSDEFKNLEKEKFLNQFKNDYNLYNLFKEFKEIQEDLILGACKLTREMIDPKGNKFEGWSINEKRGGFEYNPPLGWIGFGLKVKGKYGNDYWIEENNILNWCTAYHGVANWRKSNEQFYNDINHLGQRVGIGVNFTPKIDVAEVYAGIANLNGVNYKTVLMVKIKPSSVRISGERKDYWVTNGTRDEARPYRILFKKSYDNDKY